MWSEKMQPTILFIVFIVVVVVVVIVVVIIVVVALSRPDVVGKNTVNEPAILIFILLFVYVKLLKSCSQPSGSHNFWCQRGEHK